MSANRKEIKIKVILYNISRAMKSFSFLVIVEEFYRAYFYRAYFSMILIMSIENPEKSLSNWEYYILADRTGSMENLVDFALGERYKCIKHLGDWLSEFSALFNWE
jgi:hypothetical protein